RTNVLATQLQRRLHHRHSPEPSLGPLQRSQARGDLLSACQVALVIGTAQSAQLVRSQVTDDGNEARRTDRKERQVQRVIAGVPGQIRVLQQLQCLRKRALGVLDCLNVLVLRQPLDGVHFDGNDRPGRNVVAANREIDAVRYRRDRKSVGQGK